MGRFAPTSHTTSAKRAAMELRDLIHSQLTTTLDVRVCKTAEDRVLLLLHGKLNGPEVSSNKRRPRANSINREPSGADQGLGRLGLQP